MQALADPARAQAVEVPQAQRSTATRRAAPQAGAGRIERTLAQWLKSCENRDEALWQAYTQSGIRMTETAQTLGLSVSRVSRVISRVEAQRRQPKP